MKWELVFYNNYNLLEGPVWDSKNSIIYCVAIRNNHVISICTKTNFIKIYDVGCAVGCLDLLEDGNLIIAKKDGIYELDVKDSNLEFICQPIEDNRMRFNDGKLDPMGRFLVGYMGDGVRMENRGGLYSVEGTSFRKLIEGTTVSNGLGFSGDGKILYFIDTPTKKVMKYDYDMKTGDVSNPRIAVQLEGEGFPDGMYVLPDDTLLVCEWGGGCVSHWEADNGKLIKKYELPVTNVSSCCLGGEDMNELYITTARCKEKINEPLAGGLFKIRLEQS